MNRRDFLKLVGGVGASLGLATPLLSGTAHADCPRAAMPYEGNLWIEVMAYGAWDPMYLCDPKTNLHRVYPGPIASAGALSYAPLPGFDAFFNAYSSRLLVLNGMDYGTISHDVGQRFFGSGRLALTDHHPAFPALVAAALAADTAMPFMTNGGYDFPADLIVPTRAGGGDQIRELLEPGRVAYEDWHHTPWADGDPIPFNTDDEEQRLAAYRERRRLRVLGQNPLPRTAQAVATLYASRLSGAELKKLECFLPTTMADDAITAQMQTLLAAYRAGITASASFAFGGFDTHAAHDRDQPAAMTTLLSNLGTMLSVAQSAGVLDRIVWIIGSDFGRTPQYNGQAGTDHWPTTSMMLMGPGIRGGRVIGASDDQFQSLAVNRADPSQLDASGAGIKLSPAHVHRALRKLAGIENSAVAQRFAIDAEDVPLFA